MVGVIVGFDMCKYFTHRFGPMGLRIECILMQISPVTIILISQGCAVVLKTCCNVHLTIVLDKILLEY